MKQVCGIAVKTVCAVELKMLRTTTYLTFAGTSNVMTTSVTSNFSLKNCSLRRR